MVFLREREIRSLIDRSAASGGDIGRLEATGARNFLDLDDVPVTEEGELVDVQSVISMPLANQRCVLPKFDRSPTDPFLRQVDASGKKWIIVTDLDGEPVFVLDSHYFLRDALFDQLESNPGAYWHRPVIIRDMQTKLGDVIGRMTVSPELPDDDVVDNDLILVWGSAEADHHRRRPARPPAAGHRDTGRAGEYCAGTEEGPESPARRSQPSRRSKNGLLVGISR